MGVAFPQVGLMPLSVGRSFAWLYFNDDGVIGPCRMTSMRPTFRRAVKMVLTLSYVHRPADRGNSQVVTPSFCYVHDSNSRFVLTWKPLVAI